MGIVIDIILLLLIVLAVRHYSKKGIVAASKNIVTFILTIVLFASLQSTALEKIQNSSIGESIEEKVSERVTKVYEGKDVPKTDGDNEEEAKEICRTMSLPGFLAESIEEKLEVVNEAKDNVLDAIADSITRLILQVITIILLFISIRILVYLLLKIAERIFELPGLKFINRTLGAVLGLFNVILLIYILCGAVNIFVPDDTLAKLVETINSTYVLNGFYNNNLLFKLFM